jgi:hypothetical protein
MLTSIELISGITALAALVGTVIPNLIARWTAREGKHMDVAVAIAQLHAGYEKMFVEGIASLQGSIGTWTHSLVESHRDFMERSDRQQEQIEKLRYELAASEGRDERCRKALADMRDELQETRDELQAATGRIELLEQRS